MNWILFFGLFFLLIFYILGSIAFVPLLSFKQKDFYEDEDLTYNLGRPEWVPEDAFVIDCHSHTIYSDGLLTPKQSVLWHISNGYDGMVISDHDTLKGFEECQREAQIIDPNFLVIPGIEFTSLRVHLNIIGAKSYLKKPNQLWTTKSTIRKAIEHAHKEGAVVQFNHKDWYFHNKYPTPEWFLQNGIDGWEIYNGFKFADEEALVFIEKNKEKRVMFASAGTDVHDPAIHARVYTEILTEEKTIVGIIKALKKGKTHVYSDFESEMENPRPEKGKKIINPERVRVIKKWKWFNWIGFDLLWNNKGKRVLVFVIAWIAGTIFLSI